MNLLIKKQKKANEEAKAEPGKNVELKPDESIRHEFELNGKLYYFYKKLNGHKICAFTRNNSPIEDGTGKPKEFGAFVGVTDFTLIIATWNANKTDSKGRF